MRVFHLNKVNKLVKNENLRTFHFKLSKIVFDFDFDFSKVVSCIMTDLKILFRKLYNEAKTCPMMKKVCSKRRETLVFFLLLVGSMAVQCLGTLIYSLPPVEKKGVRELEKVSLKLAKSECSVLFNGVCLSENILPNYTNIYIYIYLRVVK